MSYKNLLFNIKLSISTLRLLTSASEYIIQALFHTKGNFVDHVNESLIEVFNVLKFLLCQFTLAGAVLGGAVLAVMRLLARSLLCLSRGTRAAGRVTGALFLVTTKKNI